MATRNSSKERMLNDAADRLQADILTAKRLQRTLEQRIRAMKAGIDQTRSAKCALDLANRIVADQQEVELLKRQIRYAVTHPGDMIVQYYL